MILIPLISVGKNQSPRAQSTNAEPGSPTNSVATSDNSFFYVLDESSNNILKMPANELLYGTVATEMPASYEEESLKAQTIASYTYFCHLKESKPKTQKYDFKINPQKGLNFISKEQMEKNWGNRFGDYFEKIKNAVDKVFGKQITYNGKPIFAAYHAISSGITEKSADVFGGELCYLTNVESSGDKSAKGYETKTEFSKDEFKKILNDKNNCNLEILPQNPITNCERTNAGTVKKITIGSAEFKGPDIRNFFGLRSANFKIDYIPQSEKFIITAFGYGHGVGMSQYGANHMAKNGKSYKEILAWYYPHTKLI